MTFDYVLCLFGRSSPSLGKLDWVVCWLITLPVIVFSTEHPYLWRCFYPPFERLSTFSERALCPAEHSQQRGSWILANLAASYSTFRLLSNRTILSWTKEVQHGVLRVKKDAQCTSARRPRITQHRQWTACEPPDKLPGFDMCKAFSMFLLQPYTVIIVSNFCVLFNKRFPFNCITEFLVSDQVWILQQMSITLADTEIPQFAG